MNLTNKQYDIAKKAVTVVAPAAITLITGLGALYKTVLGISSKNYQENKEEK